MKKRTPFPKSDRRLSPAEVYFADIAVDWLEPEKTLPAKFKRLLEKLDLRKKIEGKSVCIKVHFGGGYGYTTIHPVFVRILVENLKSNGASRIKMIDNNPADGIPRGYTREVIGCPIVGSFGESGKFTRTEKIGFKDVDSVEFSGEALDCDFFIDLSHIKGHGDCGFGGAIKNISMGLVPWTSRAKLHKLEGGISYKKNKCTYCLKCFKSCPNKAIRKYDDKKEVDIFFHHCTYCQHCVLICPTKALTMEERKFEDFSKGLALVTAAYLKKFKPENTLFINFLMNITVFCDCWGMSTASLVPDIGILASHDICAVEQASLDMVKSEDFLSKGLPKGRKFIQETGHLFQKIHGKDPYEQVRQLEKVYPATTKYELREVK